MKFDSFIFVFFGQRIILYYNGVKYIREKIRRGKIIKRIKQVSRCRFRHFLVLIFIDVVLYLCQLKTIDRLIDRMNEYYG